MNRRDFLFGAASACATGLLSQSAAWAKGADTKVRAALMHLGMNMWGEYLFPGEKRDPDCKYVSNEKIVHTDCALWCELTGLMQKRHFNMAVIDVAEALVYPSHPELAVEGSWSADRLRQEVRRLKSMGIEAVPKLNFSACHDGWLGIYGRMISTPKYYEVVKDLINDVIEVFDRPRFFHLGLDEEDEFFQRKYPMTVIRRGELWWHDVEYLMDCASRQGARPIIFGGYGYRSFGEAYLKRMSRSVVQNLCIYGHGHVLADYEKAGNKTYVFRMKCLRELSDAGFDILSCSSNWKNKAKVKKGESDPKDDGLDHQSIAWFHSYLKQAVSPERLMGEMVAPWTAITRKNERSWTSGINELADAMEADPLT